MVKIKGTNLHRRKKGKGAGRVRRNPKKTKMIRTVKHRTGKSNAGVDKKRAALPAGLRRNSWGSVYMENRRNRSDSGKNKI